MLLFFFLHLFSHLYKIYQQQSTDNSHCGLFIADGEKYANDRINV